MDCVPTLSICDALRELLPFVEFKNRKTVPMKECYFIVKLQVSVCSFTKSNTPPWVFFNICTNDSKYRKASYIYNWFFACISRQLNAEICWHKHFETMETEHSSHRFFSRILWTSIMEASIYFSSLSRDCSFLFVVLP